MVRTQLKFAYSLSMVIAFLLTVASASGLFIADFYRDNTLVAAALRGNDLVSLVVAVPLLVIALVFSLRGSQKAQLLWLGMLGYTLYNYAFYLFGAAFNPLFLIYVMLFSLSIFALIFGLPKVDIYGISQRFNPRTPVKWIGGFMLFFAVFLGGMWISRSLNFIITGKIPQDIIQTGHPTSIVYALDLSLLIPFLVLGAFLLWQRQPWGYILSAMLMIKCSTYVLSLIAMSGFAANAGVPRAWNLEPLWAVFGVASLLATALLLQNLQSTKIRQRNLIT